MVHGPNTAEVYMKKRKKINILHQKFTSFKYMRVPFMPNTPNMGQRHNIPRS